MIRTQVDAFTSHGGALDVAERIFSGAPRPWLDLSTGINARPYPLPALPPSLWQHLPNEADLAALETAAGRRYGVSPSAAVVAAPGTQALIQHLPSLCDGQDVRLLGPTFAEFERVFRAAGRHVRVAPRLDALAGADVAIVVNPNNPDGRLLPAAELENLAGRVGSLVVDEAFVDALPAAASVVPRIASERIVVLRSFGKIYGLAGLRLGFAVVGRSRAKQARRLLGPWPVSGPALLIGARALADDAWLTETRARLSHDGARLAFLLRQIGAAPIGTTPLFSLVSHRAAPAVFSRLAESGILTRPFADDPSWLRFGIPGSEGDWVRLENALARLRST